MCKPVPGIWVALLVTAALAAGCLPGLDLTGRDDQATSTPDPTLLAISKMLTQTRAAPTATQTPTIAPSAAVTATATTEIPVTGSRKLPGKTGEQVSGQGIDLMVLSAGEAAPKRAATRTPPPVKSPGASPAPASIRYDVEVLLRNLSDKNEPYNPLYFVLETGENRAPPVAKAVFPALLSGELRPGEWVRGHVTFPAPAAGGAFLLGYVPGLEPGLAAPPEDSGLWIDVSQQASQTAPLPTGSPDVAPAGGFAGVGQRVESGGMALTVGQPRTAERIGPSKPENSGVFLILPVQIENVSHTRAPYNPGYFRVKDEAGYEYPAVSLPAETLLHAGSLQRGEKVSGEVVFEIPPKARQVTVRFFPVVLLEDYSEIRAQVKVP